MSDTISLNIDTRELDKALGAMSIKLRREAMQKALQAAGDHVLQALVELTPERTDEEMPNSTALQPGFLRADMHTQVLIDSTHAPKVRIGPSALTGRVARWQNDGYILTSHGKSRKGRRQIRPIPGKHFIEAAFDESSETAVNVFLATLADHVFGTPDENALPEDNYGGENY